MLLVLPDILAPDALARVRALLADGAWADGNATSGPQSALAKRNRQLPEESPQAREAGALVLDALAASARFVAAALPLKVYSPLFSRYGPGDAFGAHVDNAVRIRRGSDFRVRSDLAATLFLGDPATYDGGELVVEDRFGPQAAKLAAGAMLLYPASSVHRVAPVTRGSRDVAFFWVQSMVRDAEARRILFDLDETIQSIVPTLGQDDASVIRLTGIYHNLLRRWAEL